MEQVKFPRDFNKRDAVSRIKDRSEYRSAESFMQIARSERGLLVCLGRFRGGWQERYRSNYAEVWDGKGYWSRVERVWMARRKGDLCGCLRCANELDTSNADVFCAFGEEDDQ